MSLETTTQPVSSEPSTAAPVVAAPVAPASAAVTATPAPEPSRFTPEQIESLDKADPNTVRTFLRGLSEEDRNKVVTGGLKALLPSEAQKTDPTPAPADPAAAPGQGADSNPEPAPPAGDAPSWLLSEEQLASASPEVVNLYKEFLDLKEKEESAPPALDPIYSDPRIAFVKSVIETGNLDLPDVTLEDLAQIEGGTLDDLYAAVDKAHLDEKPEAWKGAMSSLVKKAIEETKTRMRVSLEGHIKEAREEGARQVEYRYGLREFIGNVPEFKSLPHKLYSPDGKLNTSHPASEFVRFLSEKANAEAFAPIFELEGIQGGLSLAWTAFQSKKAGSYNKMMANVRSQESVNLAKKAKAALDGFLAKRAAPSVGTVQVPASGGNNQPLYHGFDLRVIKTQAQVQEVFNALRNQGKPEAAAGLAGALASVNR